MRADAIIRKSDWFLEFRFRFFSQIVLDVQKVCRFSLLCWFAAFISMGLFSFSLSQDLSSVSPMKTSAQRAVRKDLLESFPSLSEQELEFILPKNSISVAKWFVNLSLWLSFFVFPSGSFSVFSVVIISICLFPEMFHGFSEFEKDHGYQLCALSISVCRCFFVSFHRLRVIFLSLIDPDLLPHYQADIGAVKHLVNGSDCMCPGLTSKGGHLPETNYPADTPCVCF